MTLCEMCDRMRDVDTIPSVYGRIKLCPDCLEYWKHQPISQYQWYSDSARYGYLRRMTEGELDGLVREITDLHPDQDIATVGIALVDLGYTVTPDEINDAAERLGMDLIWRPRI